MSDDAYRDASMLELFQMEAKTQTDTLNAGLLALERNPSDARHLESCMRAAHSLKGAARIVNLTPAVPVAHVMEDCLVLAQEGRLHLTPAHIDTLLAGSDLLLRLGQLPAPGQSQPVEPATIDAYVARLGALPGMSGAQVPAADAGDASDVDDVPVQASHDGNLASASGSSVPQAFDAAGSARASRDSGLTIDADASVAAEPTTAASYAPGGDAPGADAPGADRVLRVTATTLNTLLGLSSETMVESRWLAPFSKSLLGIKRQHDQALTSLENIRTIMHDHCVDPQLLSLLDDLRGRIATTQTSLAERVNDLERFDWRLTHLGQRLYDTALACRMRPLGDGVTALPRMVRDLGRELGKVVRLDISGARTRVDRDILERLDAPLTHLLRNAVDHGIELPHVRQAQGKAAEGVITIAARHSAGTLVIDVTDDGGGIDIESLRGEVVTRGLALANTASQLSEEELLEFLFLPGFSTRARVTQISGRGVGLDAVQNAVRALHGNIVITQMTGRGTRFTLSLPLSLSVVRALIVEVAGEPYALPLAYVAHTLVLPLSAIEQLEGHQHFTFEGQQLGLVLARQLLGAGQVAGPEEDHVRIVVLGDDQQAFGVAVDRFLGERSLVVQPLDPRLGKVQDVACGALMEDGSPILVLDVEDVIRSIEKLVSAGRLAGLGRAQWEALASRRKRVLVVDDSLTVRELQRKLLTKRGYDVSVAVDGMDGWNMLRADTFDMVISDIDMPRMDGIELVTLLKRDARLALLPVMIVSYKDRPEDRQRGLDAGADYYLAKSNFHDETLLDIVEDLIGKPDQ